MDSRAQVRRVRFGDFEVDFRTAELVKGGRSVRIQEKPFQVLALLLERPGELVTREELRQALWPADTFVDFDVGLNTAIRKLREALGDSADDPRFIETLPRRGYRLIATVESQVSPEATLPSLDRNVRPYLGEKANERSRSAPELAFALEAPSGRSGSGSRPAPLTPVIQKASWRWLVGVAAAGAVIATVAIGFRSRLGRGADGPRRATAMGIQVEKLTSRGSAWDAEISPDGRYLAYTSPEEGRPAIWLRDIVEKTERLVAPAREDTALVRFARDGQAIYYSLAPRGRVDSSLYQVPLIGGEPHLVHSGGWGHLLSPDNERVAFLRSQGGSDRLFVANVEGGEEKEIANLSPRAAVFGWSPDGSQLLFARGHDAQVALFVVRADGTGERKVYEGLRPVSEAWWKPEGAGIVCTLALNEKDTQFFDLDLATQTAKPIGSRVWGQINALRWLPDGSAFVVQGWIKGEDHTLWLVSYPDGETEKLPADSNGYWSLGMTLDGTKLVSVQSVTRSDIIVSTDPATGSFKKIRSGTDDNYRLCWTADGRIVYSSKEGGSYDLYICDADGSNRQQLTYERASNEIEPAASPDGRYIVFVSDHSGEGRLFRMNRDGTGILSLTRPSAHADRDPHVTPDSRWVLYSRRDNGTTLWKVPIDGGTPVLVKGVRPATNEVVEEAFGGAASPDGRSLAFFYFTMDPNGGFSPVDLVVSSIDGRILKRFPYRTTSLGAFNDDEHVQWSRDGSALLYTAFKGAHDLWRQPVDGGPPIRVAHLDEPPRYCDWSFGDKAVACSRSVSLSDVVLITHFR